MHGQATSKLCSLHGYFVWKLRTVNSVNPPNATSGGLQITPFHKKWHCLILLEKLRHAFYQYNCNKHLQEWQIDAIVACPGLIDRKSGGPICLDIPTWNYLPHSHVVRAMSKNSGYLYQEHIVCLLADNGDFIWKPINRASVIHKYIYFRKIFRTQDKQGTLTNLYKT